MVTLKDLLNKIYCENYEYDDIKEYIIMSLRKIKNQLEFYNIIFETAKQFIR